MVIDEQGTCARTVTGTLTGRILQEISFYLVLQISYIIEWENGWRLAATRASRAIGGGTVWRP